MIDFIEENKDTDILWGFKALQREDNVNMQI